LGSIYKRGKNYYIDIRSNGKRIRKKVGPSKKLAELVLKDTEVQIAKNKFKFNIADGEIIDLFELYLDYSNTNHRPTSTMRYHNVIKNFQLFLALNYPEISKISQLDLDMFEKYKKFRLNVDPRTLKLPDDFPIKIPNNCTKAKAVTLNYEIKTLKSVFNLGIKQNLCSTNPCDGVSLLKVINSKQPRFLSKKECENFLSKCPNKFYLIFYTFINTGIRLGELIHLQWKDLDFKRKKLLIRTKDFWAPKSGEREIPLSKKLTKLLKEHRPNNAANDDFVFPNNNGGILKRKLRKDLLFIAKDARIEDLTKIHTLRHTFASHLVMNGVDLPTVQKLLGHSDIQTTMIYSHLSPDHLVDAVNKLDLS